SSIRESSSDSSTSDSSIEIQTIPRGLITEGPFEGPAEVEVTTPSNQMHLDQDIEFINPKEKNVIPENRHKWRMTEPPPVPKGNSGNIPVSLQELVYGGKTAGVGTSAMPLDRDHELLSSSKEAHETRKYRGPSEGFDTHVLQRKSPKYKSLAEKPKHVVKGPEGRVGPNKGKQTSGSSSSPHKQESASTSAKKGKASHKEQSEGQEKCKVKIEQALPTEIQNHRKKRRPWTM
ncbi:hypothetical protein O181_030413, partial [Austropuccinia psidii MF-1]|nr:hypothetical protein [Austropuccinia psidii MF-1]